MPPEDRYPPPALPQFPWPCCDYKGFVYWEMCGYRGAGRAFGMYQLPDLSEREKDLISELYYVYCALQIAGHELEAKAGI